jgi:ribosome biogenesis GTPase
VLEACFGEGRTVALLGPSGAGKSSIVNRLIGRDLLATGEVRDWDRRGRHTSVHRQLLLRQQGGLVIDTPGMRELQLWDTEDDVDESFADIAGLAGGCRFRDCRHETEPGCAVKAAVEDGRLDSGRHESFLKLQAEQEAAEARREERALLESRRKGRPRR